MNGRLTAENPGKDWEEDFSHENGNYYCRCSVCGDTFTGYKRRVICKVCAKKQEEWFNSLTPEQQEQHKQEVAKEIKRLFAE